MNHEEYDGLMARACEISIELNKFFYVSPNDVISDISGGPIATLINELTVINKKLEII